MNLNHKQVFLLDAIGAIISAFLLGVVLVYFEESFGMPATVLYPLSMLAAFLANYSFYCFIHTPNNWPLFLKIIAILNLIYCSVTLSLVIFFFKQLTLLGIFYFLGEIMIIFGIVLLELKQAKDTFLTKKDNNG